MHNVSFAKQTKVIINVIAACWGKIVSQLLVCHKANYCERVFVNNI